MKPLFHEDYIIGSLSIALHTGCIFEGMEYFDLDFLGPANDIYPNGLKLYEEITGHKNNLKKKRNIN